ncbi:MAG: homoserine kinase [Burkholderiales bacterium]|nr:homoserine kinase [Burkholderiales bacterium]
MSVYTKVNATELAAWLAELPVGALVAFKGIAAGIENTNYFVTTARGEFVLTIFERLSGDALAFCLGLMAHLARHGIPCPSPVADAGGRILRTLKDKPAALVTRLPGAAVAEPQPKHCAAVGRVLAAMHAAGGSFPGTLPNPRGPQWWRETAREVAPFLDAPRAGLLAEELRFQSLYRLKDLPRGPIHADLFRDNVLFAGDEIGGVIDFYFAGVDAWLFDVAVCVNDWCVFADGRLDAPRAAALLDAYHAARPFTALERGAWPVMLRAAALRFWLSRLYDFHLPRPGELVHAHDPEHFRRILALRVAESDAAPWVSA